jgi:hypothetical protein
MPGDRVEVKIIRWRIKKRWLKGLFMLGDFLQASGERAARIIPTPFMK